MERPLEQPHAVEHRTALDLSSDQPWLLPRLVDAPVVEDGEVVVRAGGISQALSFHGLAAAELQKLLSLMDGTRSWPAIQKLCPDVSDESLTEIARALDRNGLLDDVASPQARSGTDVLLELEDLTSKLLYETLYKNIFWVKCQAAKTLDDLPVNVLHGLAIENYHFLFRESYFDAPVLSHVGCTKARLLMNEFYAEEYGHDELILRALNFIGISRDDLADTMPLPETMALCNALAYWSNNDPLFFFTTLGILEGKDIKHDSFLEACERIGMDKRFTGPMRTHSEINLKGEHGNLTRKIFAELPAFDAQTVKRLRAQTYLFIELYDSFYTGIWNHYSNCTSLLRRVSEL
jgi:hypothetical protein